MAEPRSRKSDPTRVAKSTTQLKNISMAYYWSMGCGTGFMYGARDTSLTLVSLPFKLVGWAEALLTISTKLNITCFFDNNFHCLDWNNLKTILRKGLERSKPCDLIGNKTDNVCINVTEALSRNSCCRRQATRITYSRCVSVALGIRHVKRMCPFIFSPVLCSAEQYFPHYLINSTTFVNKCWT